MPEQAPKKEPVPEPKLVWVSLKNRQLERGPDGEVRLRPLESGKAN